MNRKHIHEDNVEAFLLDAMEGRLDASDREALAAFLEDNPSWKAELDGATLYYIEQPPVVVFPDKESLKKQQRGGIILNILSSPLWRKVAVAALIAGIAFAWWTIRINPNSAPPLATQLPDISTSPVVQPTAEESTSLSDRPADIPADTEASSQQENTYTPTSIATPSTASANGMAATIAQPAQQADKELLLSLDKRSITRVQADILPYKRGVAQYEALQPIDRRENPSEPESAQHFLQTILSNEVARGFLPEMLTDASQDEPETSRRENTIVLELPRGGKKIIDTFLKNE